MPRRNSIDDVLAKLEALLLQEPTEGRLARSEAVRLMLRRLRGEEANPSKEVGAYHRRIYRQLIRAHKYGGQARPQPWLLDHAARLRAALAYGNSILAWRRKNCHPRHATTCRGQLCSLQVELEDAF
mgnify:CR=1 FL=1